MQVKKQVKAAPSKPTGSTGVFDRRGPHLRTEDKALKVKTGVKAGARALSPEDQQALIEFLKEL